MPDLFMMSLKNLKYIQLKEKKRNSAKCISLFLTEEKKKKSRNANKNKKKKDFVF
jgi:hypothetical protein